MDNTAVVICNPISAPHVENVSVKNCSECGCEVWLAASTVKHTQEKGFSELKLVCTKCAKPPEGATFHMPSDEQILEIAKESGLSFEQVLNVVKSKVDIINRVSKFAQN